VLRIKNLGNAYEGNPRDRDGDESYDFIMPDSTPNVLTDNLWTRYD
jgi:hypothetical protein